MLLCRVFPPVFSGCVCVCVCSCLSFGFACTAWISVHRVSGGSPRRKCTCYLVSFCYVMGLGVACSSMSTASFAGTLSIVGLR